MLNKTSAVYDWGHRKKYAPQELSLSLPPPPSACFPRRNSVRKSTGMQVDRVQTIFTFRSGVGFRYELSCGCFLRSVIDV